MKVEQIYNIVNTVTQELTGGSAVVEEDLSNIVEIGDTLTNATGNAFENYVRALPDVIGKTIFVNRPYQGSVPSVMKDGWEYGSILQKIDSEMPSAVENKDWDLQDGQTYDPNVFHKPKASAKYYNSKTTFEVEASFTDRQARSAFRSAGDMNAFLSMLTTGIENSLSLKISGLVMRTLNAMTARTLDDGNANRAYNLLSEYNTQFGTSVTAAQALTNPEFIRWASFRMSVIIDRLPAMSKLFNIEGKLRFTPEGSRHFVLLNDFQKAAGVYLQSDTFNNEFTALPNAETVPYWQGTGTDYSFNSISSINVKVDEDTTVNKTGIIGVCFDTNACAVTNEDRRVTTNYNPKAEFTNYFYKFDCQYLNATDENYIVFYIAD